MTGLACHPTKAALCASYYYTGKMPELIFECQHLHVLEGELLLDLEQRTVTLGPGQALMVPRGVLHRTRAMVRTVVVMIEGAGVKPEGD